jgi:hypothetical protein
MGYRKNKGDTMGVIQLTEEEFKSLVNKRELTKRDIIIKNLQNKILSMCEFECYVDTTEQGYEAYCDDCPLAAFRNASMNEYAKALCKYPGREIHSNNILVNK